MAAELEQLLQTLTPAAPSVALDRRIAHLLREPADDRPSGVLARIRPWLAAGASLAAAAAVAVVVHTPLQLPARPALVDTRQWSSFDEQGLVQLDAHTTGYAVVQTIVHQVTYADPASDARMSWAWPQEQVWYVPVEYQ